MTSEFGPASLLTFVLIYFGMFHCGDNMCMYQKATDTVWQETMSASN